MLLLIRRVLIRLLLPPERKNYFYKVGSHLKVGYVRYFLYKYALKAFLYIWDMHKVCNYKYTKVGKCHIQNTLMFLDAFFRYLGLFSVKT